MRLHHLRMRGIGPFRDEIAIDLAALGASGTFLLEGPTGSGKSTILDAIVFALYGGVAGEGSGSDRIRSQFADPSQPSVVDLVFETTAGIFRVRRSPQYERPKKRGAGTTTQQAKALLWRLDSPALIPAAIADATGEGGGVEVRATRLDEVGAQIQQAIGLTREQFTQTVLLPQGEFQRFLKARTSERQEVLTRVFGTQMYEEIEKELEARRREARAQEAGAQELLREAVATFSEASGHSAVPVEQETETERPEVGGPGAEEPETEAAAEVEAEAAPEPVPLAEHVQARRLDALTADAAQIRRIVEGAATALTTAVQEEQARLLGARETLQAREGALARLQRRAALDELAVRLEAAAGQDAEDRQRLALHELAVPVRDALARRDGAAARAEQAAGALASARSGLAPEHADLAALLDGDAPQDALTATADEQLDRAGRLSALVDLEQGLPEREREITARRTAREQAQIRLETLAAQIAERPGQREEVAAQLETARSGAAALGDARLAEREAADALAAAAEAEKRASAVARAEEAVRTADVAAQRAIDAEHALRSRRRAGLAAELALSLQDGEPCAVCGATEHPAPAAPGADHVQEEELEAAEQVRSAAEKQLAEAGARLAATRERLAEAQQAAGGLEVDAARAAVESRHAAVCAAQQAQQVAARLETVLAEHDRDSQALREKHQAQRSRIEADDTWIQEARQRLDADTATVTEARGDAESVAHRAAAHRDRARTAQRLRELHAAADQAAATRAELAAEAERLREEASARLTEQTIDGAAAENGQAAEHAAWFASDEAVHRAVLEAAERRSLQQRTEQHRVDWARLADGLAEPGIADLDMTAEALTAAQAALDEAREAVTRREQATAAAQAEVGTAGHRAARTRAAHDRLTDAVGQVRTVTEQAGAVIRVADLATGVAGDRVRLSTYVLMRRFEDVIDAANARLMRMGDAHLELQRDDATGGRGKTGLDLLVIDRRTDQARRPDTLSGGETFIVSLALALGLADTVSAEAGGITMQTLFIDEGFGSLDPERLDGVVEEIARIAEGGRSVGIVSHVAELKTRIPDRISVRRGLDATSTLTVTA